MPLPLIIWLLLGLFCGRAWAQDAADPGIWPRIAGGMTLGDHERPEVRRWIASYTAHPAALNRMLERASPFLWFIVETAELRELPMELALLPAVESGFDAHARSVSAATGLWQFLPKTGTAYGLGESGSYDARRDPVASTRAALAYLQALHREFGDWNLALAAYNVGGGTLRRAIRASGSRDFWKLPLRQQTRDYVPKLLALAAVVREPRRYGVQLPLIGDAAVADLIATDQQPALGRVLRAAAVDESLLRRFNPGLKRTDEQAAAPSLLLPPAEALAVRAELAQTSEQGDHRGPARNASLQLAVMIQAGALERDRSSSADPSPLSAVSARLAEPKPAPPVGHPVPSSQLLGRHHVPVGQPSDTSSRRNSIRISGLRRAKVLRSDDSLTAGRELRLKAEAGN